MNKKDSNKNHSEAALRTIVKSDSKLLFYEFNCPHCNEVNVFAKSYKQEMVLCSNSACRKMIIIDNYKEIA